MKKLYLLLTFLLLFRILYAQNNGDFRSVITGNWSNVNTWERYDAGSSTWELAGVGNNNPGQLPGNSNAVTIQATHTVTIDADAYCEDLTVANTATLQGTANTLSVFGNLTNNGIFDLFNVSGTALVFDGTGNATFSGTGGTTDIHTIEVDKDVIASTVQLSVTNFSVHGLTANAPKFLTLTVGTFRLSGSFTMSSQLFVGGAAYTFHDDEGFWLDNSNFTVQGQDGQMQFNGICRISAGTFNFGDTSPQRFYMNNSSQFIMEGGTLNITGAFYSGGDDAITYNQSGGTINVSLQTVTNGNWRCFFIDNANADFTMSNGTINIIQTNSANREVQIDCDEAHTHITGGTLNIGTSATVGDFNFEIQGRMPNTVVDNTSNIKTAITRGTCYFYDNLTVNGIFRYRDASWSNVYVYGNLTVNVGGTYQVYQLITANRSNRLYLYGNLINDGTFDGYYFDGTNESRLFAYFQGTSNATVTGSGAICDFYDIQINKGSDMTTVVDFQRAITIDQADGTDANRMYVENGTLKFSGTETFTITPYYNNQWINSPTGKHWIANPNITVNWANVGNAVIRGEFVLDAGNFIAGAGVNILETATAGNQVNGGTLICSAGNFDMEQDLLISGGTVTVSQNFYMDGNGDSETGDLTITGGTLNIGDGDDVFQATGDGGDNGEGGSLTMSGGTINLYGRARFDNGSGTEVTAFTMTGGNFNIDPQRSDVGGTNLGNQDVFQIQYNTNVNFTGGILTFINPKATATGWNQSDFEILNNTTPGPGTRNFIGSTIVFGNGISVTNGVADHDFTIRCYQLPCDLGNIIVNNPNAIANNRVVRIYDQNISIRNLTITNGVFDFNGRDGGTRGKEITIYEDVVNNGEINATDANTNHGYCHLIFAGATAQNYSGTGTVANYLPELTFNNTSATGVTLDADIGATTVNLISGHVYTHVSGSGLLTVYGTATTNLVGGASGNHVKSYLRRAIPNNASSSEYDFPIGSTANFRMLELQSFSTAGSGNGFITTFVSEPQVPAIAGTAGAGMANPLVLKDIYWQITTDLNSVTIPTTPKVRLTYNAAGVPPNCIAQSNNDINGTYNSIGRILGAGTITSETFDLIGNGGLVPSGNAFLVIGQIQPITGTLTVGATGDLLNLTAIADTLRKNYVLDDVYFEMLDDYDDDTETIPVEFNTLMLVEADDYVVIRPSAGGTAHIETIQPGTADGMITIDGIHALFFDGRRNSIGSTIEWTFANINVAPGPVFEFKNDAHHNYIRYLNIKSDVTATNNGVVKFGTTSEANGNDNNTIEYCNITGQSSTPTIGIYSAGTAGATNSRNTISNCNIYDFFSATENPKGIFLSSNNTNWTIEDNKFYQTATRTFTQDQIYYGIHVNSGSNYTIAGNTIGYGASDGTGTTTIDAHTNNTLSRFCGIWLNLGNTASDIINNTIAGISFTTDYNDYQDCGVFSGIYAQGGVVNIGTSGNGNIIGSQTSTGSIILQSEEDGYVYGIKSLTVSDEININFNSIGGISYTGNDADDNIYLRGIYINNGNIFTVTNNTIGSTTTANSIQCGQSGVTTGRTDIYGIYNQRNTTVNISSNIIANLTNYGSNGGSRLVGILASNGNNILNDNIIHTLTSYSERHGSEDDPCIAGIRRTSTLEDQQIINNEIYGLRHNLDDGGGNNDGRNSRIVGITYRSCPSQPDTIARNFIHNFGTHSTNEDAILTGLYLSGNDHYENPDIIANNMIQLGIDESGNSVNQPLRIYGINYNIEAPVNFYHNSIYIGGTTNDPEGAGSIDSTFCIYKRATSLSIMKNNIFVNERSNSIGGSNGRHYAMYLSYEDVVNSDYNIYNVTGTGGVLANFDGTDFTTMRAIKAYADNGNDYHSGMGDPNFVNSIGNSSNCNLHLTGTTPAEGMGYTGITLANDFDDQVRSSLTPVDIGADAGNFTFDASVDIYPPNFEYTPIEPQACGTNSVSVNVTINDQGTGLPTSGALQPRVYYRDQSGAWAACTNLQGTNLSQSSTNNIYTSNWRFTLTGLVNNRFYEYYFVAQDRSTYSGAPNIAYSKFDDNSPVHTDVNTVTTYPDSDVEIDVFTVCVYPAPSYTVGNLADCPTCDFESLTAYGDFFYNLNSMLIDKDVTCYIAADTDEPATYGMLQTIESPAGSNFKIRIEPIDTTTIIKKINADNTVNRKLIRFEGGDRYTFDGQLNNDKNRWLEFSHDRDDQPVFYYFDDSQNDTIEYLTIIGAGKLNPRGTIFIDSTTVSSPSGNDDNIIRNNRIISKSATEVPLNVIYSRSCGGADNSGIEIIENEIKDFQNIGIWVIDHNTSWTISSNTIYNTFVGDTIEAVISINSGNNYLIDKNRIGGSDINLGGNAIENNGTVEFNAIYLNVQDAPISNITNNYINNIEMSRNGGRGTFRGIYIRNGTVNVTGNIINNLINRRNSYTNCISYAGSSGTSVSNNTIKNIDTYGNGDLRGIYIDTDNTSVNTVQNNIIQSINVENTGGNVDFFGIYSHGGNPSVTGNIIGGVNAGDKITFKGGRYFRAIYIEDPDDVTTQDIQNNQILNIETTGNSSFYGIGLGDMSDETAMNFQNNTIDNIILNCSGDAICFRIYDGRFDINNNTLGTAGNGISNSGTGHLYGITFPRWENQFSVHDNTVTNFSGNADISCISTDPSNQTGNDFNVYDNTISGHNISSEITFIGFNITDNNREDAILNGNTVSDITMTNTGANTEFVGFRFGNDVEALVGNTSANTVGHATNTNSISIVGGTARGLYFQNSSGTITASNNLVANISASGNTSTVHGAVVANTGGTVTVSDNTIRNLSQTGTGNCYITGVYVDNGGDKTVSGNTIYDITTSSQKTNIADGILASQGIFITGNDDVIISGNTIYNISASGTANTNVAGISENSENATITKNKIYGISNTSTGSGTASGIVLYNLNAGYVANNYISIGENDDTEYSGIWLPQNNANTKRIYFNSVYIGENATGGNSYAFLRNNNSTPLYIRNNIFSNFRTGGAGKHYSIANLNTSNWSSNVYMKANCYYSATSATTGLWGSTDNDFETWLTNTGESDEYLSTDEQPHFTDAPNCDLHISDLNNSCGLNSVGEVFVSVTDDFDGDARNITHPDIGADEFTPTGRSGKYIWRGWNTTVWDTDGNWQCEDAPGDNPGELIVIPQTTIDPILGRGLPAATVFTDAFQIRHNGILTINPGNSMTLSGNFELNGEIIIETPTNESDATGSFIDNGTITGSGQMTTKRYINANQWHEVSSAVENLSSAVFTETYPSGLYNINLYWYDETVDLDGNPATEPAGAFDNNNLVPGWQYQQDTEGSPTILEENEGYIFYTDADQIITMQGSPSTGNYDATSLSWTNNDPDDDGETAPDLYDGWHLLGNPYPSSIDWDLIRDDQITNVDDGIYVWDNTGYSGYKNGIQVQQGNLSNVISPMQGFFVHTNATNAEVQIRNEHRTHQAPTYLKSAGKYNLTNLLKLKTSANGHNDFIAIQFLPDATNEYDGNFDLVRMFVNPDYGDATLPQLYSITENENDPLSLNVLPENEIIGKVVPLGLSLKNAGNCSISVAEFNDFNNIHVYFTDSLLNQTLNLRTTNTYSFDFAGGNVNNRFFLNFEANHAPVLENIITNQETSEDAEFNFTFAENTFIDEDFGDILHYEASIKDKKQLPEWLVFNSETRTFSGIPLNEHVGEIELQVVAFDMFNESDTAYFTIKVINTNDAPTVANNIPDMETNKGELYSYIIPENTFNDVDLGDILSYSAQQEGGYLLPEWLNFNADTRTLSGISDNVETINIEIIATDIAGEFISDIFILTVNKSSLIDEVEDFDININPNPTDGIFYLNISNFEYDGKTIIQLTDISGKILTEKLITTNNAEIDISKFLVGTYFVNIKTKNNCFFKKVIKK